LTSKEDLLLAELAIEKYAEAKGLDVKEVKARWMPILEAEPEKDSFTKGLLSACAVLGQIKDVSKGLDPATQKMLGELSSVAVQRALNPNEREPENGDEALVKTIRRLKMLDHAFTDEDALTEKIAKTVSQEVATPLAQALTGLQETLKEIAPKVQAEPEVAQSPEFEELRQTMENINTTLVKLAEKIDKGTASQPEIATDVEAMVERISVATEKSKDFLSKQGFKVVAEEAPATFDEAKKIVEGRGFTLQDQRVERAEAERMAREAAEAERRKHEDDLELKLEERKIAAAEKVVGTAIDKVMEPFKYFLERYLNTAVGELPVPEANPAPSPAPTPPPTPKMETPPPQPEPVLPKPKVMAKRARKS